MKNITIFAGVIRGGCYWLAVAMLISASSAQAQTWARATGGVTNDIEVGTQVWRVHTFRDIGTNTLQITTAGDIEYLLVAGGGGGGGNDQNRWGGAGGGAGGMVTGLVDLAVDDYPVFVGDGGAGSIGAGGSRNPGQNSNLSTIVALGGGGGRGQNLKQDGGSGSGGALMSSDSGSNTNAPGVATQPGSASSGYGNAGGFGTHSSVSSANRAGGGGGGAGDVGGDAGPGIGGAGGPGRISNITGRDVYYAGGGGGSGISTAGAGGMGGGGAGVVGGNGEDGAPNTGGGGGASGGAGDPNTGGKGGSGIVIVRYVLGEVVLWAPSGLTATMVATNQIDLAWTSNSPEATGFIIERSATTFSGFEVLDTVGAGVTTYSDTSVSIGQTWYYRVIATDGDVNSVPSFEASATVTKLSATIMLGNLHQLYNGLAREVSVTTTPPGLMVEVTYDGSPTPPVQLGSYAVAATIVSDTYQGTTNASLVIAMLAPTVTVVHPTMDQRIGYPAIIAPGGVFPSLQVESPSAGTLEGAIYNVESRTLQQSIAPRALTADVAETVTFSGSLPPEGVYRIDLRIIEGGGVVYRASYYFSVLNTAALPSNYSVVAHPGPFGVMRYIPDVRGNRLPDFSGVGYLGGQDIPDVPTVLTLGPEPGDATARIQNAINTVSALPLDENGFRGALQLEAGLYAIGGTLQIAESGVVLRGSGWGNLEAFMLDPDADLKLDLTLEDWWADNEDTDQTVLVATGPDHRVILTIAGFSGISTDDATSTEILDDYVPVGRRWFHVANPEYFSVGDTIQLERRGNADWISEIKMDQIPGTGVTQWSPVSHFYEYIIRAIDGTRITVDSGVVNAVEQRWGGGRIRRFSEGGRIRQSGVENLRGVSFWIPVAGAQGGLVDHTARADRFVLFNNMRDGWARNIATEHFTANVAGAFQTRNGSTAVTIENSSALSVPKRFYPQPEYESSGRTHLATGIYMGRYGFHFGGQNGLVRNSYAINSRHAFVVSSWVSGPNVFSDSLAVQSLTYSEPHQRWSVAGLYDNVEERDDAIGLMNRLSYGSGHGWAGANYVAWNTKGGLVAEQPPTAQNWAIGHVGTKETGPFHQWNLDNYDGVSYGYWESHGQHVTPLSLYTQQIADEQQREQGVLVFAGSDNMVVPTSAYPLHGSVYTYGTGPVSQMWSQVSGPTAIFANSNAIETTVSLLEEGEYVLKLTAWEGDMTNSATVTIVATFRIALTSSDATGTSSFNTGLNWSDGQAPGAGKDYSVTGFQLRAPVTTSANQNFTFAGDSLQMNSGGTLAWVGSGSHLTGSLTIADLILNGGTIGVFRSNATVTMIGNIMVTAQSSLNLGSTADSAGQTRNIIVNSTLSGSERLRMNAQNNSLNVLTINGNNSGLAGGFLLTGTNADNVSSTLTVGHTNALGTGTITVDRGILNLNGHSIIIGGLAGANASGNSVQNNSNTAVILTVDSDGNTSYTGLIQDGTGSGNLALVKAGSGSLTLLGTNAYTGATTVDGGVLRVNGSLASGSEVTVNNGGTLAGSGTVGGGLTIANGGTFLATDGAALTVGDAVTLQSGSILDASGIESGSTNPIVIMHYDSLTGTFGSTNGSAGWSVDYAYDGNKIALIPPELSDYQNWLQEYYGDPNFNDSLSAASGVHTIREAYIAGLNPTNAAARFVIQDMDVATGGDRVLQWAGVTGRLYNVYWSSNLMSGAGFELIASNIQWNVGAYTDTNSVRRASPNSYYRISVQLED